MPPWRQLPAEDLRALVAYVHSLHAALAAAPPTQDVNTLDGGESLFVANSSSCQSGGGAGNGAAAGPLAAPTTNFHLKKPPPERAWDVSQNGVPGTARPPGRSELSADQRRALVEFVRSLYGPAGELKTMIKPNCDFNFSHYARSASRLVAMAGWCRNTRCSTSQRRFDDQVTGKGISSSASSSGSAHFLRRFNRV